MAHEICHAISKGLKPEIRDAFYSLSWAKSSRGWALRPGLHNFVSEQAPTNTEEDFAKICGYYMTRAEALRNKAADKLAFLKTRVFRGLEFHDIYHSVLQAYLKAILPEDVTPPHLTLPIDQTFDLQVTEGRDAKSHSCNAEYKRCSG